MSSTARENTSNDTGENVSVTTRENTNTTSSVTMQLSGVAIQPSAGECNYRGERKYN